MVRHVEVGCWEDDQTEEMERWSGIEMGQAVCWAGSM